MNRKNLQKWCAENLRYKFNRPLFPKKQGHGVLPWVSGPGLHTRIFLNTMRDPNLKSGTTKIEIIRFNLDGEILSSDLYDIKNASIHMIDLPESKEFTYGYCWAKVPERHLLTIAPQFHIQIMATHSVGKTHGRGKGIPFFGTSNKIDKLIEWLDPFPYEASSAVSSNTNVKFGLLILNVSDRVCDLVSTDDPSNKILRIKPHGAALHFEDPAERTIASFRGTSPFTLYILMMKPDHTGITIQHTKDLF